MSLNNGRSLTFDGNNVLDAETGEVLWTESPRPPLASQTVQPEHRWSLNEIKDALTSAEREMLEGHPDPYAAEDGVDLAWPVIERHLLEVATSSKSRST